MMLGNQLRQFREASGVTTDTAGYEIRASRSKISRMENGRVGFKERDVADLLTLYGVTDGQVRAGLLTMARQANAQGWWTKFGDILPDWFDAYLGLEEGAALIRSYEVQFVHGLLQSEGYARAVTQINRKGVAAEEIERRVSVRMQRQNLLTKADPPRMWAVMDEAVLRRPAGGRQVMREQVKQDLPDIVYIEQLTSALYLEKREDLDYYLEVMDQLSSQADTPASSVDTLAAIYKSL
jgi:DNA-binding XRE family transcriptional regulator